MICVIFQAPTMSVNTCTDPLRGDAQGSNAFKYMGALASNPRVPDKESGNGHCSLDFQTPTAMDYGCTAPTLNSLE